MGAPPKNDYARKPADQRRVSRIEIRTTRDRKAAYVRAAAGEKLAQWIERHLDRAAGFESD